MMSGGPPVTGEPCRMPKPAMSGSEEAIHIAFASDDGYVMPTLVAMTSVLANTSSYVAFHILDDGIAQKNRRRIERLAQRYGAAVDFIETDRAWLGNFPADPRLAKTTYLRLRLPACLPDVARCIYLDGDLVVRHDIAELWNLDLHGKALAAVKDIVGDFLEEGRHNLQLDQDHIYFNAGVLVMDLARLRAFRLEEKAIAFAQKYPERIRIVDQDILNVLLQKDVAYFPLAWNYCLFPGQDRQEPWCDLQGLYSQAERTACRHDAAIVHFANAVKPWHCSPEVLEHPYFDDYFRYVALTREVFAQGGSDEEAPSPPKISVIVPAHNAEQTLSRCLRSLLQQSMTRFEVIVVDDGSTDQTTYIAERLAAWNARITVVATEQRGRGAAYNAGLQRASGEYLVFVEPEDWLARDMFRVLLRKAEASRADLVRCDFSLARGSRVTRYDQFGHEPLHQEYYSLADLPHLSWGILALGAGLYRREFLAKQGIRFLELPGAGPVDAHFVWTSHAKATRMAVVNRPLYFHQEDKTPSCLEGIDPSWRCLVANYRAIRAFLAEEGLFQEFKASYFWAAYTACSEAIKRLRPESRPEGAAILRSELSDLDAHVLAEGPFGPRDVRQIRRLQAGDVAGFVRGLWGWREALYRRILSSAAGRAWDAQRDQRMAYLRGVAQVILGPQLLRQAARLRTLRLWKLAGGFWRHGILDLLRLLEIVLRMVGCLPGVAVRFLQAVLRRLLALRPASRSINAAAPVRPGSSLPSTPPPASAALAEHREAEE